MTLPQPRTLRIILIGFFLIIVAAQVIEVAPAFAEDRFVDNGNGTITDHKLGLLWAKADNGKPISFSDAQRLINYNFKYTIKLPYEVNKKYGYWRLPTVEELKSLVVENKVFRGVPTKCGPSTYIRTIFDTSCILLWASDVSQGNMAFNFNLKTAFVIEPNDYEACRVLPVRSLKK